MSRVRVKAPKPKKQSTGNNETLLQREIDALRMAAGNGPVSGDVQMRQNAPNLYEQSQYAEHKRMYNDQTWTPQNQNVAQFDNSRTQNAAHFGNSHSLRGEISNIQHKKRHNYDVEQYSRPTSPYRKNVTPHFDRQRSLGNHEQTVYDQLVADYGQNVAQSYLQSLRR